MSITTNVPTAKPQTTSYTNNGFSTDTIPGGVNFPLQQGVPYQNLYTFKVIPVVNNSTCIGQAQTWPGASTSYTFNSSNTVVDDKIITKAVSYNNFQAIKMDCERSVCITTTVAATDTSVVTITGYDYRGVSISASVTLESGEHGHYITYVPFSIVTSVIADVDPGVEVSIGNGNAESGYVVIGFPYALCQSEFLIDYTYGTETVNRGNIIVANPWRLTPPLTQIQDITDNSSARGGIYFPFLIDGTSPLVVTYLVGGSDSEMNAEIQNEIQSTLNIVGVQKNTSEKYVIPYLTKYDLVGMQYPGDYDAAYSYNALLSA